jgi:replicative DNA helicase
MISKDELNQLSDVVNYTWGKSSGDGTRSLTCALQQDEMIIKYSTVVHFASEYALKQQVDRLVDESMQIIVGKLDHTRSQYKEVAGTTLKLEEISNSDSIEMVSASIHNPRKIAIYRRNCVLRVK